MHISWWIGSRLPNSWTKFGQQIWTHQNIASPSLRCSVTLNAVIYLKCLPQICTKMNISSLIFSKIPRRGAPRVPSSDPYPRFSRASSSVWASTSILRRFAHPTRAFALNFRLEFSVRPLKINSYSHCFGLKLCSFFLTVCRPQDFGCFK